MTFPLREAARMLGLQPTFRNDRRLPTAASERTLRQLITLLSGDRAETDEDLNRIRQQAIRRCLHRPAKPTQVAWDGKFRHLRVIVPEKDAEATATLAVPGLPEVRWNLGKEKKQRPFRTEEETFLRFDLGCDLEIEFGYFDASLRVGTQETELFIISAPRKIQGGDRRRDWGLFAPTYALWDRGTSGIAGLTELERLQEFTRRSGGDFVGTLPFLSVVDPGARNPSPYSPSSRLFWNELFLDSPGEAVPRAYVDYPKTYAQRKTVLLRETEDFFAGDGGRSKEYTDFLELAPEAPRFAEFRARGGDERRLHLYAQFEFHRRLGRNHIRSERGEIAGLYLDYPVGVDSQGFDAHRYSELFLPLRIGAPPDAFFQEGQNWGLLPMDPSEMERTRYAYFIATIRTHLRYCRLLRLDHAMALHRLYVIPEGAAASEGAYLTYPSEDLYAILCLEAMQHGADLIAEDLGTVPDRVRVDLAEHRLKPMWIYEIDTDPKDGHEFRPIPEGAMVALNTHDMPPFAKFCEDAGATPEEAKKEFRRETLDLARSPARRLLINIEDLWGEVEPQNVPGRLSETYWRKRHRYSMEEWTEDEGIRTLLAEVGQAREKESR